MTITPDTTTSTSLYQRLRGHLATLKLHDAAEALPSVLDRAQKDGLSMTAALEQLLSIEVDATETRRLAGRLRFACLPTPASLDDFDYDAAPGLDRALITELGTCRFLETATNVLLIGPPGGREDPPVGGFGAGGRACRLSHLFHHRRGSGGPLSPRCDRRPMGDDDAVLRRADAVGDRRARLSSVTGRGRIRLVQVVAQRYLKTSIIITTNRGVGEWGEVLGDTTVAAAMLDRLLHRSVVLNLDGDSYRLRDHHARLEKLRQATTGTRQPLQ